jgi:hypothetical protein
VVEEDRVGLTRVRPPEEDDVRFLDLDVRDRSTACTEHCRQTDDGGCVSSSVAGIDVVRPHHHACELLGEVVHLVRGLRAGEHAEGVRLRPVGDACACESEPSGSTVERLVPRRDPQWGVLRVAYHRCGQPRQLGRGQAFVLRAIRSLPHAFKLPRIAHRRHAHRPAIRDSSTMRNEMAGFRSTGVRSAKHAGRSGRGPRGLARMRAHA